MKQALKRVVLGAFMTGAIATAAISATLHAQEPGQTGRTHWLADLNLTDEQKTALGDALSMRPTSNNPLLALASIYLTDAPDAHAIDVTIAALIARHKATGLVFAQNRFVLQQILTAEQLTQLREKFEQRASAREERRNSLQRGFERLSLTDEQVFVIEEQRDTISLQFAQLQQIRAEIKGFEDSLLNADSFNSQAWQDYFDTQSSMIVGHLITIGEALNGAYDALDDDQQQQLKQIIKRLSKPRRTGPRANRVLRG